MKKNIFTLLILFCIFAACSKKNSSSALAKDPIVNGSMVFKNNCTRCHGETGMNGRAPNLAKSIKDMDGLVNIISHGHDRMPTFSDKLSQKEIVAVADWVFALRK